MVVNLVTPSRFAELFVSALRDGIASENTAGYKTGDGYTLFIEPEENRVEAFYHNVSTLKLTFYEDNTTWKEREIGRAETWEVTNKMSFITALYEQVRAEKGEREIPVQSDYHKEMRKRLGLDIDF